jgi:protein SCO1
MKERPTAHKLAGRRANQVSRVRLPCPLVLRTTLVTVCFALLLAACGGGSHLAGQNGVKNGPAPEISLRDQDGRLVDLKQQRGRVVLLTFLYTHCKDICPLMASTLNAVIANVKPEERDRVRAVAVSIDPSGDTFASARRYVRERNLLPQFHYLVGTKQDLEPVWSAYGIVVDPIALESIDHTGRILVIDRDGKLRASFPPSTPPATLLGDVEKLL